MQKWAKNLPTPVQNTFMSIDILYIHYTYLNTFTFLSQQEKFVPQRNINWRANVDLQIVTMLS